MPVFTLLVFSHRHDHDASVVRKVADMAGTEAKVIFILVK
jgi:hypothetical protein